MLGRFAAAHAPPQSRVSRGELRPREPAEDTASAAKEAPCFRPAARAVVCLPRALASPFRLLSPRHLAAAEPS